MVVAKDDDISLPGSDRWTMPRWKGHTRLLQGKVTKLITHCVVKGIEHGNNGPPWNYSAEYSNIVFGEMYKGCQASRSLLLGILLGYFRHGIGFSFDGAGFSPPCG